MSGIGLLENFLVSVSRDNTIKIWDLKSSQCRQTLFGHDGWIRCVSISINYMVTGGNDNSIIVWDANGWAELGTLAGHTQAIESVKIAPANTTGTISKLAGAVENPSVYLASCSRDGTIKLWDLQRLELVFTFEGHTNWVKDIDFYQGTHLVSCSDDRNIKIWDLASGECISTFLADEKFVNCVTIHPFRNVFASGSISGYAKLWSS